METEKLGRFDHHPNPAIDFEVEVDVITGMVYEAERGMIERAPVRERIARAMEFRVGGVPSCVDAKGKLRELEAIFCQVQ